MQSMQSQLERERQRRILEDRRAKDELRAAEEQERERLRAEKRAAKVSLLICLAYEKKSIPAKQSWCSNERN